MLKLMEIVEPFEFHGLTSIKMNNIRQIQELNKRELENGVGSNASWHADYRDTAYIYIGGLPFELSEGDIITIFSQFGEPTYVNLIRDKETGKSKGFAFLKYEDQRSTDLAVDNLGGATVMNRTIRVDHTRYKTREDDTEVSKSHRDSGAVANAVHGGERHGGELRSDSTAALLETPMLREEREVGNLISDYDDDDPLKEFLIREKRKEISSTLAKSTNGKTSDKRGTSSNRHRHHHRSEGLDDRKDSKRHSRHRRKEDGRRRSRSRD